MGFITSLIAFIVAIAILVAIHEYGHYWVAKTLGVKVLRFSIGFGKPIWRKVAGADRTEYVIGAIPLGGYVKMLDEREKEVPEAEKPRAFNRQPVSKRIAIVAAGPIFNFLFAVFAYTAMYMVGVSGMKPVIGEVIAGSPAALAELQSGDIIVSVENEVTPTWETAGLAIINQVMNGNQVRIETSDGAGALRSHFIKITSADDLYADSAILGNLGIKPWRLTIPAVLGRVLDNGPGARAGLKTGDRILAIDGQPIDTWEDLVKAVRARPGEAVSVEIEREGKKQRLEVSLDSVDEKGFKVGRIGAGPFVDPQLLAANRVEVRYGPVDAFIHGVKRTWEMSVLTLRFIGKMITGQASLDNVSGPLTIAQYAGVSALIGVSAFLGFLGIVSVSLGVLNLLPIPVLDGGHLLFYFIELIKGSPLSEMAQDIGQRVGLGLLALLMALAFFNDFNRLFGQ